MKLRDWLWCKLNGICTKHRREKVRSYDGDGCYSYECEDCRAEEKHARILRSWKEEQRKYRLGIKDATR